MSAGGVLGNDGDPLLHDLVGDGAGNLHLLRLAHAASGDRGHQLAGLLVPEHDGDPVHRHDLERGVHDGAEEAVEVELGRELLGDLEQHLELERLAGFAARGVDAELTRRRAVTARDARRDATAHHELPDDLPPGEPASAAMAGRWSTGTAEPASSA